MAEIRVEPQRTGGGMRWLLVLLVLLALAALAYWYFVMRADRVDATRDVEPVPGQPAPVTTPPPTSGARERAPAAALAAAAAAVDRPGARGARRARAA